MNKYQRLIVAVAVVNVLVMLLFPPFNDMPLSLRAHPSFDGYFPLLGNLGHRPINTGLLTLQLMFVAVNALAAWLVLQNAEAIERDESSPTRVLRGIGIFAAINLAVILLFPPFEPYAALTRPIGSTFDSFYFVFGSRVARPVFAPLLYLECVFVAINALALWLLFNAVRRREERRRSMAARATDGTPADAGHFGRGPDRRHLASPRYRGPERRSGADRRHRE